MVSFKMSPHHCQTTWKICKLMQMIGKPEALGGLTYKEQTKIAQKMVFVNILNNFFCDSTNFRCVYI